MELRKIIHIDMDAFYASVEQRDKQELRGKPVIVGGSPDKRGVVAACSYEARGYGIHSAMPSATAKRLCPQAIFLKPRFEIYRHVSSEITKVFSTFTDKIEPLSLDEAYLDVSECKQNQGSATMIALEIKKQIKEETGLVASAGVSYNKFLAKIASDMDKPDGLYVIKPEQGEAFVEKLAIGKFFGIGKATEGRMKALGIHTGADLKRRTREELSSYFGKIGSYFYNVARGIDDRPVKTNRARKSIGTETTFEHDLDDKQEMLSHIEVLAQKVVSLLKERAMVAKTITLKVKYIDFTQVTRSQTMAVQFDEQKTILPILPALLDKTEAGMKKVRLLGITASNLSKKEGSLDSEQIELL